MRYRQWIGVGAGIILGLIFVAAGLGKLLQAEAFKIFFNPFPSALAPAFAEAVFVWLPSIELIVGLLLIIGVAAKLMAAFSSVLIAGFMANNSWLLSRGLRYEPCGCFGWVEAKLSIVGALYLDIGMLALVLIILFCYQGDFFNSYPWFWRKGEIE